MNEAQTRAEYIDPALREAGWGVVEGSRILREHVITHGRLEGHGKRAKPLQADYVLVHRNRKLAVVEAKAWDKPLTEGVAQANLYASKLEIRFAFSTNGQAIYQIDRQTGKEGTTPRYPSPEELWQRTFAQENAWRDRFAAIPTPDKSGSWSLRFYQDTAVNRVLDAVSEGRNRILLTMATGTGKTSVAFQIVWKLFQARWNLSRQPARRPRILFLADRNNLATQAYNDFTSFAAFADDALARVKPEDIRKKGRVPTNASLFFTIFQTFMSGTGPDGQPAPYFGEYPPDFFDFVIIDECHRGGANDESTWRGIMDYFAPAVQLGLTATPKRKDNADTYLYFGEPVYTYSLREGINDGFLTPFRVKQIATTLDDYIYAPDDEVLEGEVERNKRYTEADFNRKIEIEARERKRVEIFMRQIPPHEKTLVFCATQLHALAVRNLINQMKTSADPDYCVRVTADDGIIGDEHLKNFQDNERTMPTILTTSQKLSTGVDARNVRNIVLMRPVNSMIEFKQIIGRGTRIYEGKDYFTIYDFVEAHHHFNDPEWDGDPLEPDPCAKCGFYPCQCERQGPRPRPDGDGDGRPRPERVKIRLADGKDREIQTMQATSFWHPDGTPMSARQFMEALFGSLPDFFHDEDELRRIWSDPKTRRQLLDGLAEKNFGLEQLKEMQLIINASNSDLFDVLAFVAYALPPLTREERATRARLAIQRQFNSRQQAFLEFVLAHYIHTGVEELDPAKLTPLLRLKYGEALHDAIEDLGTPQTINQAFVGFQRYLYQHPESSRAQTAGKP